MIFIIMKQNGGLIWNDKNVGIIWPEIEGMKKEDYLTSEKDKNWPTLEEVRRNRFI